MSYEGHDEENRDDFDFVASVLEILESASPSCIWQPTKTRRNDVTLE